MISVIMPVWIRDVETLRLTQNAITSIKETGEDLNWIIIDNGSTMGSAYLKEHSDIYIRNKENIGYPAAVNQGAYLSKQRYYCIANNDIRVPKNVFKVARDIYDTSNAGSIHYKMVGYNEDGNPGENTWLTGKERWCSSSFFIIKSDAFEEYDESYGLGGFDDWDFWHRVRHVYKWNTAYTNRAYYQHLDSHTQNKIDPDERSERDIKNREYFRKKFGKYPEDIWNIKYPDQMSVEWKPFP